MKSINDYITLIRKLPLALNIAWLLMHIGLGIMVVGMIEERGSLIAIGAGVVIATGAVTLYLPGEMAARFSTALIMHTATTLIAMIVIVAPICLLAVVGIAIFDEISWNGVMRVLRFMLVLFTFFLVTGIPTLANRETGSTS